MMRKVSDSDMGAAQRVPLSRRAILKLSLSVSGLLVLNGIRRFLSYSHPPARTVRAILSSPQSYPAGSASLVPEVRCWLVRDDVGLYALSAECTHLGCLVQHSDSGFECPCHGSTYDLTGEVIAGPASRPLRAVKLALNSESRLVIDTGTTVPAGWRLEGTSNS